VVPFAMAETDEIASLSDDLSDGHAESVEIVFDPARISYREILEFLLPDSRPEHAQSPRHDVGSSYRSGDLLYQRRAEADRRRHDRRCGCFRPAVALTTYQIGLAMTILFMATSLDGIRAVFNDTRAWTGLIFGLGCSGRVSLTSFTTTSSGILARSLLQALPISLLSWRSSSVSSWRET